MKALIQEKAALYKLDPEIVACVISVESGGDTYAIRFEPGFYKRYLLDLTPQTATGYVPKFISWPTEKIARSTSFGVMQVMGETARSIGQYKAESLARLCEPADGIEVGCRVLRHYLDKHDVLEKALAAYNAGDPRYEAGRAYAKKVMERHVRKEHEKIFAL